MYAYFLSPLKRRILQELKDSFARHPVYSKIVPYIENKYVFEERPPYGIVLKGTSINKTQLAADNYIGTVVSHVMLATFGQPVYPLEWIREDHSAVRANGGRFPTAPGVYYLRIEEAPTNPQQPGKFIIDPLLTVTDEVASFRPTDDPRVFYLQHMPVDNTFRLWLNRSVFLREGLDFTRDQDRVTLTDSPAKGQVFSSDYRYAVPRIGPVDFYWNTSDQTTLPGVVLAFGKRAATGNTVGVVVYPNRVDAAQAYGGRIDANFDLTILAQDPIQMEEIADHAMMVFLQERRSTLGFEGIEVVDVSLTGESEDVYDEAGDTYYYQVGLSLQVQADWEVHYPLPLTISRVSQEEPRGIKPLAGNSLYFAAHPVIVGRNSDFERIGLYSGLCPSTPTTASPAT